MGRNISMVLKARLNVGDIVRGEYPNYSGPYAVTPRTTETTLGTKNKTLKDDILIKKIPVYEVGNTTGTTIYIGGDDEYGV